MPISLPELPYDHDALEPHVSRRTLEFHHGQHHRLYVEKVNELIKDTPLDGRNLHDIVSAAYTSRDRSPLFNAAAQAWNHDFYWNCMKPGGGGSPEGEIAVRINDAFEGFEDFSQKFRSAASSQFGSGWTWLVLDRGVLKITNTSNADVPLVHDQIPLLTIDVWEHAYYLDYQNRRKAYIDVYLDHLLDWEFVNRNLEASSRGAGEKVVVVDAAGSATQKAVSAS